MKRIMAILFAIVAAAALMQADLAYGISGSAGMVGTDGFGFFATASGTKNGEDKLAEALGQLQAWKAAKEQEKKQSSAGLAFSGSALSNSTADNASLFNKAAENSTLNNVRTDSIRININNINNINNTTTLTAPIAPMAHLLILSRLTHRSLKQPPAMMSTGKPMRQTQASWQASRISGPGPRRDLAAITA